MANGAVQAGPPTKRKHRHLTVLKWMLLALPAGLVMTFLDPGFSTPVLYAALATAALAVLSLFLFLCRVISGTNSANIGKPNGKAQVLAGTIAQAGEVFSETHVRGSGVTVAGYGASSVDSESVNRREVWVTTTDGGDIQIMIPAKAGVRAGHRVILSYYKNHLLRLINLDTDETHALDETSAKALARALSFFGVMILLMGGWTIMGVRPSSEGMVIFGTLQLGWLAVFALNMADRQVQGYLEIAESHMLAQPVADLRQTDTANEGEIYQPTA